MIEPTQDDIGRKVLYIRREPPLKGVITSLMNDRWVFVRYEKDKVDQVTRCEDLEWVSKLTIVKL